MTFQEERAHIEASIASFESGASAHRGPLDCPKEDITARWIEEDRQALAAIDAVIAEHG